MKKALFTLLLFSLMTSAFIQKVEAHSPPPPDTIYLIIDKHIIPLALPLTNFKPKWIKSATIYKKG